MVLENFIFRLYDTYSDLLKEIPEDDIALIVKYIEDYIPEHEFENAFSNISNGHSNKYDVRYMFFIVFQANLSSTEPDEESEDWCVDFIDANPDEYPVKERAIEFYCDPDGYPETKDILTFKDLVKIIKYLEHGNT